MADANETNPPALWWSPEHGLITWKADQYAADGGTYWKRSTGGVSLRHDGHPNALPADAVRLGDLSALETEVSRLRADLEKAHNYVGTLALEFGTTDLAEMAARARRALETPPDDEAVERALEPIHEVMCPCGWELADCRRELDPDKLRDIARAVLNSARPDTPDARTLPNSREET